MVEKKIGETLSASEGGPGAVNLRPVLYGAIFSRQLLPFFFPPITKHRPRRTRGRCPLSQQRRMRFGETFH